LLCVRGTGRRCAEKRDEIAPPHLAFPRSLRATPRAIAKISAF
jgi:hypothetical protein